MFNVVICEKEAEKIGVENELESGKCLFHDKIFEVQETPFSTKLLFLLSCHEKLKI
jgi:hypothetical protein